MEMEEVKQMLWVMVLAAIKADGKELDQLTDVEIDTYVASAAADIKLVMDLTAVKESL